MKAVFSSTGHIQAVFVPVTQVSRETELFNSPFTDTELQCGSPNILPKS